MSKGEGKGRGLKGDSMLKADPAGIFYEKSIWVLKSNERASVGNMPLLSEFAMYASWEAHAKRWKNRLYNRPVSRIIEYFIINSGNSVAIIDRAASDYLKRQLEKIAIKMKNWPHQIKIFL